MTKRWSSIRSDLVTTKRRASKQARRLTRQIERLAKQVGAEFVPDGRKLASYVLSQMNKARHEGKGADTTLQSKGAE